MSLSMTRTRARRPWAGKAGKIVAVGSRAAVETAQKGPKTQMVDLGGKTMIPGFIDAHGHVGGRSAGGGGQLIATTTVA